MMNKYREERPEGDTEDIRASWAVGFAKASEISSIALEAILPALLGVWLDQQCSTILLFFSIGLILGMIAAVNHLLHMVKSK
ncbi:MAG: AtpZ/AtpI family protein [Planctomycetia bacterium]|nr:AtpZ/AtpI family protein [Planctomycetia bacterium]